MSSRLKKVAQFVHQGLAQIFQNQVNDPRLSLVSITEVRVTPDLRNAHIYFHVIGLSDSAQIQEVTSVVERASGFFRSELARLVKLKFLPALHFHYDDLSVKSAAMLELIDQAVGQPAQDAEEIGGVELENKGLKDRELEARAGEEERQEGQKDIVDTER